VCVCVPQFVSVCRSVYVYVFGLDISAYMNPGHTNKKEVYVAVCVCVCAAVCKCVYLD